MNPRAFVLAATLVLTGAASAAQAQQPGATLRPFRSERDLEKFTRRLAREYAARRRTEIPVPVIMPAPEPVAEPAPAGQASSAPAPAAGAGESITNVQTAGVDEGGIVKRHGDHLVILRRGRLFTVKVGGDALLPVDATDAFGPGIDPARSWYDEMLVSDSLVVVIGYSYARGGTEVGLFRIGGDGRLAHRGTYQLRSGDYYSARNYASRLIGSKLVFYAPVRFDADARDFSRSYPAVRRWGGADTLFHRTAPATRIYRPATPLDLDAGVMLHTVTVCDLRAGMECQSTALFGPRGSEFYVSRGSVYVWTRYEPGWDGRGKRPASMGVLYRMPLDGSAPTGLRVRGEPIDQMSFLESADGHLNVLLRWDEAGAALSLLRVPLASLGDGSAAAPERAYRPLPGSPRGGLQNRYVGDWLLYGAQSGWQGGPAAGKPVHALRWAAGDSVQVLPLPHGVDRIEAMGAGAVVVGSAGRDLHFTGIRLGTRAEVADRYVRPDAAQGESRTHGFFYRPDDAEGGLLGLPVRSAGSSRYASLREGSASVLFLRNRGFHFTELGALASTPETGPDGCRASCVDWYGNARPVFLGGRILALMGYEIVEGAEDDGRIRETRRVSFAPAPANFAGVWDYEETAESRWESYACQSRGTYRVTQDGAKLVVEFEQTGRCTAGTDTASTDHRGTGTGVVGGDQATLTLAGCSTTARLTAPDRMEGTFWCPTRLPNGRTVSANGRWTARRR
ncbi:MAG TPA: beta-propeller domain-containing protein [Longimicrobiaceae bacterium]|nr:beta-propeller domain-containing protein [Longimicrobiaceae bacterium]